MGEFDHGGVCCECSAGWSAFPSRPLELPHLRGRFCALSEQVLGQPELLGSAPASPLVEKG